MLALSSMSSCSRRVGGGGGFERNGSVVGLVDMFRVGVESIKTILESGIVENGLLSWYEDQKKRSSGILERRASVCCSAC